MIEGKNLTKRFGEIVALDKVDMQVKEGQVFGLLGTNGSGKSTMLRLLAGILMQDEGEILIDGQPVFDNPRAKRNFFYISDEQFFFTNSTPEDMARYWQAQYAMFDQAGFFQLLDAFHLNRRRRINTFSKGMKKQLILFAAVASNTRYILCDESFDGLDPVVRQAVKSLFADRMAERGLTPIIASHSLRELEDICDTIGLLHNGKLLLSHDLVEVKQNVHKVQAAFAEPLEAVHFPQLDIISAKNSGRVITLVVRGDAQQIQDKILEYNPLFVELLPLTLEEVFISETEVVGYEFKTLTLQ